MCGGGGARGYAVGCAWGEVRGREGNGKSRISGEGNGRRGEGKGKGKYIIGRKRKQE